MDIRIFDRDINFLGEVDNFTSLFYISKWETYGEFEFHIKNFNKELIAKGNIIMFGKDGNRTGVIEHFEINQEDDEDITVKGFSLGYWFANRITIPPVEYAYHRFNTTVEDIMVALVKFNAVDPLDINRKIPNLVLEPSKGRGVKLEFQTRYKVLEEELTKLSKASGLGWNIILDYKNKKFIFKVLDGKDLSTEQSINPPQVFSVDYDNIRKQNYLESNIGYKNMAYVAGQGEGANREIELLNNTLSGFDRRETFIDARDIEEGGNLTDRGKVKLAETPEITTFECEVDSSDYKKTWNLGDIVTTINKKLKLIMHNRVTEVKEVWEQSGYKVEPTFGTTIPTIGEKIKQTQDTPLQESVQGPSGEKGERGPQGYSVQYLWSGTKLGIKREDETSYSYVDLKGTKGDIGPKGEQGIQGLKGDIGIGLNFLWNGTKLGIKRENESVYQYVELKGTQGVKGDQGIQGKSLEFNWNGTQLGIRVEGQTNYTYVELKGEKGNQGIQGIQGDRGPQGVQGIKGDKGDKGDKIKHQWSGTILKLENPDGSFDGGVNLKGDKGEKGDIGPKGPQGVQGPAGNGQSYVVFQKYFIATQGQKIFSWNDGYIYPIGINAIAIYINGVRVGNKAFIERNGNSIELITALENGDNVFIEAMQAVVDLQGPKGADGKNLEFVWNGTQLGVRQQGETSYIFTNLQGPQGLVGATGSKGDTGATGAKGDTWKPSIDTSGNLSWTLNNGTTSPTTVNIKGPKGDTGTQGPVGPKGDIGATGPSGANGITPTIGANGNWFLGSSDTGKTSRGIQGLQGIQGPKGDKGDKGDPGTTDYNNLLNKPTIPSKTSQLTNDSGFVTSSNHNHDGLYTKRNAGSISDFNSALTQNEHSVGGSNILNAPYTGSIYGKLRVYVNDGGTHNNNSNWIWQYFDDTSGRQYFRYKVNSGSWTSWKRIDGGVFAPSSHTHTKSQITDMPTKLSQFTNDIGAGGGTQIIKSATQPTGVPEGTVWI